jgi:hypothetical protein
MFDMNILIIIHTLKKYTDVFCYEVKSFMIMQLF